MPQPNEAEVLSHSAACDAYLAANGERKASAKRLFESERDGRTFRGIGLVAMDENNTLRAEVIGVATATWDPASMANAAGVTSPAVTVTGAAFGDIVAVAAPYDLQGILATAYVSAADTVRVRLHNSTGGAVNLASGTWKVVVRRVPNNGYPQRTVAQAKAAIVDKINSNAAD